VVEIVDEVSVFESDGVAEDDSNEASLDSIVVVVVGVGATDRRMAVE
jgi:hypothetical protein